jgi:hypothetical protein
MTMKITQFDAPGNNGDFAGNLALAAKWSTQMSQYFDQGVSDGSQALTASGGGTPQFYNPLMHGLSSPDVTPPSAGNITWNGFPRRFLGTTPGAGPNFAAAEPTPTAGHRRNQDEYLEWHVTRNNAGKIASVAIYLRRLRLLRIPGSRSAGYPAQALSEVHQPIHGS